MNTLRSMSIFEVSNLELSVRHYGSLGFALIGDWEEYQVANMQRGDVTLMFQQIEGSVPANRGWACYVYVTDIKALHEEFEKIENLDMTEISERPWAVGEFQVADHDGHKIAFGEPRDMTYGAGLGHDRGYG